MSPGIGNVCDTEFSVMLLNMTSSGPTVHYTAYQPHLP